MNRHGQIQPRFLYRLMLMATFACTTLAGKDVGTVLARNSTQKPATTAAATSGRSPSDTVREFYKAMREKRFREAFAISIYKPAIEGLKPEEFDDLRPDFERLAAALPDRVEINGEQISADEATVFVKVKVQEKPDEAAEPITLIRVDGNWIVGDKENQAVVQKAG